MLSGQELTRYDRQIMIPGIGREGQEKLKKAKVLVAGAGGLGSPVSIYLAASGVGSLRIVDHDRVELSNLNRQVLHWEEDLQKEKVLSAQDKLRKLNRHVDLETMNKTITKVAARAIRLIWVVVVT